MFIRLLGRGEILDIFDLEIKKLSFYNKKVPISADMRPLYRITRLMLVLKFASRKNTASLMKLHLFDWTFQNPKRYKRIENMLESKHFPNMKFDPFVIRALNYGLALDFIILNSKTKKMTLTEKGVQWIVKALEQSVFINELQFLNTVGKSITESKILELSKERYQL